MFVLQTQADTIDRWRVSDENTTTMTAAAATGLEAAGVSTKGYKRWRRSSSVGPPRGSEDFGRRHSKDSTFSAPSGAHKRAPVRGDDDDDADDAGPDGIGDSGEWWWNFNSVDEKKIGQKQKEKRKISRRSHDVWTDSL